MSRTLNRWRRWRRVASSAHLLAVALLLLLLGGDQASCQVRGSLNERKRERLRQLDADDAFDASTENFQHDVQDAMENVCAVKVMISVSCYCDSLIENDALTASCWIFGNTREKVRPLICIYAN